MKLFTAVSLTLALVAAQAQASHLYSNTEYCELAAQKVQPALLKAYSKKLGVKPVHSDCAKLLQSSVQLAEVKDADAQISSFARGSARKLPASLIQQLKAMSDKERMVVLAQIYG